MSESLTKNFGSTLIHAGGSYSCSGPHIAGERGRGAREREGGREREREREREEPDAKGESHEVIQKGKISS